MFLRASLMLLSVFEGKIAIAQANVDRFNRREEDDKKYKKNVEDMREQEEAARAEAALQSVKQASKTRYQQ